MGSKLQGQTAHWWSSEQVYKETRSRHDGPLSRYDIPHSSFGNVEATGIEVQVGFADIQSLLSSESLTLPVLGPVVDWPPNPKRECIMASPAVQ